SRLQSHHWQPLSWLQTMKQPGGYSGPVPHYWEDCFNYIGSGRDWRYEGIIISYLSLYEKTKDKKFLELAKEAGDHLVDNQLKIGCFNNSGFDGNPSIIKGSMPHDTAASIGLMKLALKLRYIGDTDYVKYFHSAKINLDTFHLKFLYDKSVDSFLQNTYDKKRYHVPNKLATLAELCLLFYEFTGDKKYYDIAIKNGDFILAHQEKINEQFKGGIYQVDKSHNKLICLYIARCISGLVKIYEASKVEKYLNSAIAAADFIKTLEDKSGGFYFGYQQYNNEWKLYKYPIWIAGAGDIVRAFLILKPYKKYNLNKNISWITQQMHKSGSFPTSYGLNFKDKLIESYNGPPSCRDSVPAVGWNDKTLRLLCMLYKKGEIKVTYNTESESKICSDGTYYEDVDTIKIIGDYSYEFKKNVNFSSDNDFQTHILDLKTIFLNSASFIKAKLISSLPSNFNNNNSAQ
ncbi:MAG: hypothetical protein AABW84_01800, partial [Nanoarchaeota archaeon]